MMRELDASQRDRAAGVLLGTAVGDALGVPYEFATPPGPGEYAEMRGGGLGNFAPGQWSDDTSMAIAIARAVASGADLTSETALDQVASGFLEWFDQGPPDVGIQTRAVLSATRTRLDAGESGTGRIMGEEARAFTLDHERSAGNGALMRTGPVALAHLDDREACATAARSVASLTHADPLAGDSCVLWSEAIRIAVLEGRFNVGAGLDLLPESRREDWAGRLAEALGGVGDAVPGARFSPNGYTVTALQAALCAIVATPVLDGETSFAPHLPAAIHAAVRIGDDTDTVAAIAGGLLGARWGASAVPEVWRRAVHGWPAMTGDDLVVLLA